MNDQQILISVKKTPLKISEKRLICHSTHHIAHLHRPQVHLHHPQVHLHHPYGHLHRHTIRK